ncbi:uncharacterized protein [Aegilops tauschii subsp. strangulata]|uniref:uncharacterized protein isoform X2 n=1 Tax=Aegilops tauschii subsp. strangulata TaxID=200361 RepID=UPI001ABCBBD6|nr:uncharacterized protein LOC109750558 isoform X2 [Aegilops tauschii subsp. strangulata]
MDPSKLGELRSFVEECKKDPALLADPALAFCRDYLTSLDANLPAAAAAKPAPKARSMDDIDDNDGEDEEDDDQDALDPRHLCSSTSKSGSRFPRLVLAIAWSPGGNASLCRVLLLWWPPFPSPGLAAIAGKIKDAISALAVATLDDDNDEVTERSPPELPRDGCSALQDTVTTIDILGRHAYDNMGRFTARQLEAVEKLWNSIKEQQIRRKHDKSTSGKLDVNAFERLQEKSMQKR